MSSRHLELVRRPGLIVPEAVLRRRSIVYSGDKPSLVYLGPATSTATSSTTENFAGASFSLGTARGDRIIIALLGFVGTAVENAPVIAGITATLATNSRGVVGSTRCAIYAAAVPTGTTGTLSFTSSSIINNASIQLYAAYGLLSTTAFAGNNSSGNPTSTSLNVPALGLVFGVGYTFSAAVPTVTWSGLTKDAATSYGSGTFSGNTCASLAASAAITPLAVSVSYTGSVGAVGAVASFR